MNGYRLIYQYLPVERTGEIELMLLCARGRSDDESAERIRSLADEAIDWEYLVKAACSHKLHLLLYHSLKKTCPESVPGEVLKKLEHMYTANSMRSLVFSGKLLSILKLLKENRIPAIPFKGPVLAEMVYGDLALRQFGDLDILVDRENAFQAVRIFENNGFRPEVDLNQKQFSAYAAKKNSMPFISTHSGLTVDLHWEMSGGYTYDPLLLKRMEKDLVRTPVAGQHVPQPGGEKLLIYLCLHGTAHLWNTLESVSSVAGLIACHGKLDWMQVEASANCMRCERILHLGLFLAQDLFDVALPEDVMERIKQDPELPGLAATVYRNFIKQNDGIHAPEINSKFSVFHLRVRDRWSEKFRYAGRLVFGTTAQDWIRVPVPAKLAFVYNILRPARLAMMFLASRFRIEE